MSNKERWLFSTALLVSVLPFILLAGSMQILPDRFSLPQILKEDTEIFFSKYRFLYLGLMGFIPAALMVVARIFREKRVVERNFKYMAVAALCLGAVFLVVAVYGVIYNIHYYKIDLLKDFEFFSASVIIISLFAAEMANFFPLLKRNEVLGLKNRYTMRDNRVWTRVHEAAADVYMGTFYSFAVFSSSLCIFMDFRLGWVHLILWVVTATGLIVWGRLYSRHVSRKLACGDKGE